MQRRTIPLSGFLATIVFSLGFSGNANAQKSFQLGVSLSGNVSSVRYTPEAYHNGTLTTGYRAGLAAGVVGRLKLSRHWAIQPSLRYLRSGFNTEETVFINTGGVSYSYYQNKYALNRLEVPINVLYCFNTTTKGFYLLGGVSVGTLLGGRYSYDNRFTDNNSVSAFVGSDDIKVGDVYPIGTTQYYMQRWDVGIQAGIGYQYNRVGIQAAYRLGVRNTATNSELNLPSPTIYSSLAEVQACYYLFP